LKRWIRSGILGVMLLASGAHGGEAPRIAVVHEAAGEERVTDRLRAELRTLGLSVVDVSLAPGEGATSLDDAARRVGAFAAVQVVPARGGVEVWIADRVTGKTLLRELVVAPGAAPDDVVALQAVELLRASLAELRFFPKPHGDVEPTPAVTRIAPVLPPEREGRRFVLELGPAIAVSPSLGASGHAMVGIRFRPTRLLGIDLWSVLPVVSASIRESEGSADVSPTLVGADVAVWLLEPSAAWQVAGAGGIAIAHLAIDGRAAPPLASRSESSTVALPFGRFSIERRLGSASRRHGPLFVSTGGMWVTGVVP
jgi:hypothetical protein